MTLTEAETCPSCGSGKLTLQGRMVDGKAIRELICLSCKHAWRIELPFRGRRRP
jgi:DNA-directed RNA polymerase subunit M/transcription elongation factor TFIIS